MLRHLPNLITALRIALVWPLCWLIASRNYSGALMIAAIAGASDALDGFLAKRFGWQSWIGGMLDPIADKILLTAAFVMLTLAGELPLWFTGLVIGRDVVIVAGAFAYYFLIGRFDAAPSALSKLTTTLQIVFVLLELLRLSHWIALPGIVRASALALTAIVTIASGVAYVFVWGVVRSAHAQGRAPEESSDMSDNEAARIVQAPRRPTLDLRWQWLILLLVIGGVIYLLSPVLTPFVVAALFAYLADPLVDRLERFTGRNLAVCVVFLVVLIVVVGIVLLLIPLIERQISSFLTQLPVWLAWFQQRATPWLESRFGLSPDLLDTQKLMTALQAHWKEAGGVAATVVAQVSKSGLAIVGWTLNLVMIPVVAFYLLRDWDILVARIHALIPRAVEPVVTRLTRESDDVLGAFLRGQLSVMIALGIFYGISLWLVGVGVGPLIGMIAGLISFVPYLGAITGVMLGVVAALVQYQDWFHVALVLGVFAVGQTLEGYVLVPKLVGDKIGLHPVAVIFAILAGGELFGFIGVLLALPVASVIMVLLRYLYERYTTSELYTARNEPQIFVPDDESPSDSATIIIEHGAKVTVKSPADS